MTQPLGTIDLSDNDINIRQNIYNKLKILFKKCGASELDTPVFELYDAVDKLYGDEFTKSVFTIKDGKQELFLRYDLTVPLARHVGMNGLTKFKRFQYGKVYRKDDPQIQKCRFREFHQMDYDIIGDDQQSGINDIEIIGTLINALSLFDQFIIKINYKNIVIKMLQKCNIPESDYQKVFSAIDKLDKKSWNDVKIELFEKQIDETSIQTLENYYELFCNSDDIYNVLNNNDFLDDIVQKQLKNLMMFISNIKYNHIIIIDPFLIRGMDYYTGILFEVTYVDKNIMPSTIAAGGRYDNMIDNFSSKQHISAVGMSIGIDRLVKIIEKKFVFDKNITPDIYIATVGNDYIVEKMSLLYKLREFGYYVITSELPNQKMRAHFKVIFEDYSSIIPIMIIIGENEVKNNTLTIKDIINKKEMCVSQSKLCEIIATILNF